MLRPMPACQDYVCLLGSILFEHRSRFKPTPLYDSDVEIFVYRMCNNTSIYNTLFPPISVGRIARPAYLAYL